MEILVIVKKAALIIVEVFHAIILPETSLPVWIHVIGLKWWLSFLLVAGLGNILIFLIFWPKQVARVFPIEKERIERQVLSFFRERTKKIGREINKEIKLRENQSKNGKRLSGGGLWWGYLIPALFNLFRGVKNWLKKQNHLFLSSLKGLGYLGIVVCAGLPYFPLPGIREAGLATVFVVGGGWAKILFITVGLGRLFIEAYLMRN